MSADEESFIVLEETPSMLQFSLLDSLTLNSHNETLDNTDTIKFNVNIIESATSDHSVRLEEPSIKFEEQIKSTESDLSFASLNAESISTAMAQSEDSSKTPPKTTLAQSFLLGDINCDKMKVIFTIFVHTNIHIYFKLFK